MEFLLYKKLKIAASAQLCEIAIRERERPSLKFSATSLQ